MHKLLYRLPVKVVGLFVITVSLFNRSTIAAQPSIDPLGRARLLIEQGQYNIALSMLNTTIKKNPGNAKAYAERSIVYGKAGQFEKSIADSSKAISLNPMLAKAYSSRAAAYLEKGEHQKAIADSDTAVRINPQFALAHGMRSFVLQRFGKCQQAITECNKAIVLEPRNEKYYLNRAVLYRELGLPDRALQDCNKALRLVRKARCYIERGATYLYKGDHNKAVADFILATKTEAKSAEDYAFRADAFYRLGQYQKQIENLTLAIKLFPQSETLFSQRSYAYYCFWQLQKAISDGSRINALPVGRKNAILASEELGRYDKAFSLLALSEERNAFFYATRAKCYEMFGNFALAQADWKMAKDIAKPDELISIRLDHPIFNFEKLTGEIGSTTSDNCMLEPKIKFDKTLLPFNLRDSGQIGVPVQINGQKFDLELDTGCPYLKLWKKILPEIGSPECIPWTGRMATGKKSNFGILSPRELRLGSLSFAEFPLIVERSEYQHAILSGLLGGNILENFALTVDFENSQLIFAPSFEPDKSKELVILPMLIRGHTPFCSVRLNDKLQCMAQIDTGGDSIAPDSLVQPILEQKLNYEDHIYGPWLGKLQSSRVVLKKLSLGAVDFKAPVFYIFRASDAPLAGARITIGIDFLKRFKMVTFDYPGRRVIFEPH